MKVDFYFLPPESFYSEFPTKYPEDINEKVKVFDLRSKPFVVSKSGRMGFLFLPESHHINDPDFKYDFIDRFGERIKPNFVLMKFKLLFAGYQLYKKDKKQFQRVLKTAQNEEEFCALAGVS